MKKIVIFTFMALVIAGCNIPYKGLDVTNGSEFVVTSKRKVDSMYLYTILKVGETRKWYDYEYIDTTNFDVGDTLTIKIQRSE